MICENPGCDKPARTRPVAGGRPIKYCGDGCGSTHRGLKRTARNLAARLVGHPTVCANPNCDKPLDLVGRSKGGTLPLYCERKCTMEHDSLKGRWRSNDWREVAPCAFCGEPHIPPTYNSLYCGQLCRQRACYWRNSGLFKMRAMERNEHVRIATPPWADRVAIRMVYDACPEGFDVDHRIPLRGEKVSGLHVIENLQYLTPLENSTKHNTFVV